MKDKEKQEKVFDILNKFEFFQGQRAGRELWNDKPKEAQDKDISDFIKDINYIRSYLQDSVVLSREEYEKVDKEIINKSTYDTIWKAGYNAYEKTIGECVAEARKETAEKFAEMLKEELENCSAIDGYDLEDLEFDGEIIQQCINKILSEIRQMLR